jgi:outer membrane protein TolC
MVHLTQLHGTAVAMITAGVTSTSDVLQVEAAMATIELRELEWRAQAESVRLQLAALTGSNTELVVSGSHSCLPNPDDISGESEHPSIVAAQAQVDAASHRVALADLAALPTPMITGGVSNTKMNWEHSLTIGVGLNIPLPTGVRAQRERSSADQASATLELAWQRARIGASVAAARVELERAIEQVDVVEHSLIPAATRLAQVTSERVAMGEAPMSEAIQAERALTTAKMQLNRSVAKAWSAYATLQRATGLFSNTTSEREQ